MKRWTHRQYLIGLAWLKRMWTEPDLTDVYLMQLTREVACVLASPSERSKVSIEDFRLKFKKVGQQPEAAPVLGDAAKSLGETVKARWLFAVGYKSGDKGNGA